MATNPAMLDRLGLSLAVVLGALVLGVDLHLGQALFFPIFLVFLVASVGATKFGYSKKREMNLYEHERSWENVLANGLVPALAAIASPALGWGAYVGSVAAITADKFASELGVLGGQPISLLNFKPAKKGESGCISIFGTLMSLDGALIIGVTAYALMSGLDPWMILYIGLVGAAGSMADSIAGVLEERGIGTKATTNLICALVGAILGWAFLR
ncbi:Uncharacterised protein [uncultured archaeon]|nr:Uncharacterised protein [uncultured archaeon]